MSLDLHECERCLKYLDSYSGEHLCKTCATALGRDTHDPYWGAFSRHPDRSNLETLADEALAEVRLQDQVERDLRRTIEIDQARAA